MLLDVGLVHLGDVAEKVSSCIDRIVTDASDLALESRKLILDFREFHIGRGRNLLEHDR